MTAESVDFAKVSLMAGSEIEQSLDDHSLILRRAVKVDFTWDGR